MKSTNEIKKSKGIKMSQLYIAIESFSAIIIFILLYANIFELKQRTKKRSMFTKLLIANEIVVVVDTITWLRIDWANHYLIFSGLITITYIVPMYIVGLFSKYIYRHISEKSETSKVPFNLIMFSAVVVGTISLVLCVIGKMFVIKDGKYYGGDLTPFYYLFYILSLSLLSIVIIANSKKLGIHDLLAALSFCFFPLISIIISMSDESINLAIPAMAINMLIIYIFLESENENHLYIQSNIDEMTGLLNRRAYEENIKQLEKENTDSKLVYAAIDVNGLKQTNDNIGHSAGDELICGAASCLKQTFGDYGRIYRTGGDEFVAIFYATEDKLKTLSKQINETTENWRGTFVKSLVMSIGYASKKEFSNESISEISKIADKRMYEAKRKYYAERGVDRRGQAEAHKALCNLYTKILKINLTTDSFSIINIDISERTDEKGFSNKISEWFLDFGKSGQVHKDDLDIYLQKTDLNYLKSYFSEGKSSITISYKRKYGDVYKQVVMEMIPTDDYKNENQTLFLYVKSIDL